MNRVLIAATAAMVAFGATAARAQEELLSPLPSLGKPQPGGIALQDKYTELAHDVAFLDNFLLVVITLISLFVTGLLVWVCIRYNAKRNPEPQRFTHNTPIEIAWTVIPVVILIVIGSLSLPILFKQLETPEADVTIKVTGYQWYWGYEYPDAGVYFDSFMLERDDLEEYGYAADEYLLATDTAMVVPVNATVKLQITAADVIHAWKIPAFAVHMDAVPGRLNETWFKAEEVGVFFGQCSELCGINHSYMPITVKVVPQEEYDMWLEAAIARYADAGLPAPVQVAAAE